MGNCRKSIFFKEQLKLKPLQRMDNLSRKAFCFFNKFSIRNQIIFFFLVVSLIPIIIIGVISYSDSKEAIIMKNSKYSQNELSQTIQNLEMKLQGIESISMQFVSNTENNKLLRDFCNVEARNESSRQQDTRVLLQSVAFNYKDDYAISFVSLHDTVKHIESSPLPRAFFENNQRKFFKQVIAGNGRVIWSLYSVPNKNNLIVMGRIIKDTLNGDQLGILFIFVNEKTISDVINPNADTDKNDNYSIIIDENGTIISNLIKDNIGKNIFKLLNHPQKIRSSLENQQSKNSYFDKINNQEVMLTGKAMDERNWYVLSVVKTSYLYEEIRTLGWKIFIIGIVFAMFAVFISIAIAINISNPLNQVVYAMKRVERGDFTVRANVNRKDELGFLGAAFDRMIDKIGHLLHETKEAMNAVLGHSKALEESSYQSAKTALTIAATMEQISKGTMEQTVETEKSSTTMNDLAKQIESMFLKANEVEQISGFARELSLKSNDAVEQLIAKNQETDQITEAIIKDIFDLNNSAAEIREITETITNIAEQTNLLGLNASIEAARAGEMGQGFAVVSEEVNKLAIQSRNAAKTINSILHNIEIKTANSSNTVEQAHQIFGEQRLAVKSAQIAFTNITAATSDIISQIAFVNQIIHDINNNKEHASQSIMNISTISEQTAVSAQEVSASSEEQTTMAEKVRMLAKELHQKAEAMAEIIAKFQI
ncbi:MAG TPA: hypothetical protein DDW65_19925 [Firmicutes bacterium]|jgi:methyl-accepting chemotaxis protein|nr:hypothetical protein [Bacillota bacterium]